MKPKTALQDIDLLEKFKPENLSRKTSLKCEKVNEVTFKITNEELTNVPTSYGQWGGYRTTKALAWIIGVGPNSWLARCENRACGPASFPQAKADALAMARGAIGDYYITNPIKHLNQLTVRLIENEGSNLIADTSQRPHD